MTAAATERATQAMPIAIAHDYLTQKGGAERVVLALHRRWPEAPIYTTFYDPAGTFPEFENATIITSRLNWLPLLRKDPRRALPLLPLLSSSISVKEPMAVVSSSGWAHGFRYRGGTLVYCHTPARWVYLLDEYLGEEGARSIKGYAARAMRPLLRVWDRRAMSRRTQYLANSTVVRERIRQTYGMDVPTVFPPHAAALGAAQEILPQAENIASEGFLLSVARLLPYKNVDLAIQAAKRTGKNLLIIGKGPDEDRLRALAGCDPSIVFAKDINDGQLAWAYAHAEALIAVSYEDFGLTPLEASARGIPTIALHAGGYLDTIREHVNGLFVEAPTADALVGGIARLYTTDWDADAMRSHAEKFSEIRFAREMGEFVEAVLEHSGLGPVH